jgi:dihydroflavonol-4-reductase
MMPKKDKLPKVLFGLVDVRDVAAAHVNALEIEEAKGKRFILVDKCLWREEMAEALKKEFEG